MKNILFNIMWFVVIAGAGFLAYMAMGQLDYEFVYERPNTLVADSRDGEISVEPIVPLEVPDEVSSEEVTPAEDVQPTSPNTSEDSLADRNPDLNTRLAKLISDKIQMKSGSYGTRVATVQMFLNLFDSKDVTPDNDYGPGTQTRVKAFQTQVGIDADGFAGPQTYQKMIDWLKSN